MTEDPRMRQLPANRPERSITLAQERMAPYSFEEDRENPLPYPLTLETVPARRTKAFGGLRRNILVGAVALVVFASGVSTIVAQTIIAGAVIAYGNLAVESGAKQVQHPSGGIVRELLVAENQKVEAGEPLIRLDVTVAEAQARAARHSLAQQQARLDRLGAERDGLKAIQFSPSSEALRNDPEFAEIFASEMRQFRLRSDEREGQRAQIRERILQAKQQNDGSLAELQARQREIDVMSVELEGLRGLYKKRLVSQQRVNELERELSQLEGAVGSLTSTIAAGNGKVAELELMITQVDQNLRAELTDQIANAQQAIAALEEKEIAARTELEQSVIYAPQSGVVYQLAVHTVGGVITPAEPLMTIIPQSDELIGTVKINPADIDQLYAGQHATLSFSAFDRGTTPTINATLASVSPDLKEDQQRGTFFYQARIDIPKHELDRLGNVQPVAGMPIEVFIQTGDRTLVSYFLKPLTDQMNRAFR